MSLQAILSHLARLALLALVAGAAQASDALVDTDWLERHLGKPGIRVIEVSVNPGVFERGHIPGAVNFAWHTDLVDPVRRDIADRESFQALLRKAGISEGDTIVLYGDTNNWFAAWGAWIFDIYGVDNVKLLDGGRNKWEAERRPLSVRASSPRPGTISVGRSNDALRAFLPDVLEAAEGRSNVQLVDIRSPDEYSGRVFAPAGVQELAIRAGHVPGAVNVPWDRAVAADGTFRSADELRELYAAQGIDGALPVIVYCRIGERSSHTWFALRHILGYDVRNYDGSWTEYGNAVGVPIVNLAGTVWGGK